MDISLLVLETKTYHIDHLLYIPLAQSVQTCASNGRNVHHIHNKMQ